MKRTSIWLTVAVFAAFTAATALAQSQSETLGDIAREQRKKKYEKPVASKVYTDDNLPSDSATKEREKAGQAKADPDCAGCSAADANSKDASSGDKSGDKAADAAKKPAPGSVEEFTKNAEEWKKMVEEQKKVVEGIQKQLEDLQQQYRLRASAYYADSGLRLRDGGSKWAEDEQQFRKLINDKQTELDAAKQKLSDLQDRGHKSGAPSSALE